MLSKLIVRNFKRFDEIEVELGNPVVFIGPNNSGKSTALQALALWNTGLKRWLEKRAGKTAPEKRPGVTINRRDLFSIPVPHANLLWRDLRVRDSQRVDGKQKTANVNIEIVVEAVSNSRKWTCGLEFDFANEESLYCRPLLIPKERNERMPVPEDEVRDINVAFLPAMSGLAANELRLDPGAVHVRIGEGRTAEVLRNLCYQITESSANGKTWAELAQHIRALFGVTLDRPTYVAERGEIAMTYATSEGVRLDLSSAGRGLQQVLLLLSYMYSHRNSVLLLDEPDAHLEILRQRQIYRLLSDLGEAEGCQLIIASHSEVLLNEAADKDVVVAFVGKPHRIDDRGSQVLKSLKEIGFDQYYQAEQRGWVLYLEGATDLQMLQAFAEILAHPAQEDLSNPFVHYVLNQPLTSQHHFHGLAEAKPNLVAVALFDRLSNELPKSDPRLRMYMWKRREIENYLCQPETLNAFAETIAGELSAGPLFAQEYASKMHDCISDRVPPAAMRDRSDPWWADTKMSDDFLDHVFEDFYKSLSLPNLMRKTNYHVLARYVPRDAIDPEIERVLDMIHEVATIAKPVE